MTSMQVNKKSHGLVKTADDLITPNEYTLDIIPLPIFSVDIYDSEHQLPMFLQDGVGMKNPIW